MRSLIAFLLLVSTAHADFNPKYSRYDAAISILRSGAISGAGTASAGNLNYLKLQPLESGHTNWWEWVSNTPNSSGGRGDVVRMAGWNVNSGGGLVDSTNGALYDSWEEFYITAGGSHVMERHLAFAPPLTASDTTTTRFVSALGDLSTGLVGLNIYANTLLFGHGHTNNDPAAIIVDATTTTIMSPTINGFRRLLLDDNDGVVTLSNGDFPNHDRGHLKIDSSGIILLDSINLVRIANNGGLALEAGSSYLSLSRPDDNSTFFRVDSNGAEIDMSNSPRLSVRSGATYTLQNFRPASDSAIELGASGGRFLDVYAGAPVASQVSCNSDSRGAMMTVFANNGSSDTFQICMKSAADTYAWRTVYTAP